MADAIVSVVLEQLTSIIQLKVEQEVRLVVGVRKEVKELTNKFQVIQAVLDDAEQRQVKEAAVRVWLDQLKDISYDMEDVLDEWNTATLKLQIEGVDDMHVPMKKVCCFFPSARFCFKQVGLRRDIALKIKEINENMNEIVKNKATFSFNMSKNVDKLEQVQSTSIVDVSRIYGRIEDRSTLVSKLLCDSISEVDLHIISIVGMGGIGKTTLAQFAYNDNEVVSNFDKRIWVCVSDPFNEFRIAKAIIEALEGNVSNLVEFNSLIQKILKSIRGKKFLIVFDDVWTEDYNKWEPFYDCLRNGLRGSKILITTRKETVACMVKSIDIISIKELSEEDCWLIFRQLAFFGRSLEDGKNLEEIGRKIVWKCKGLPLATKIIGSLLRFKRTKREWERILDSELWKLEEIERGLLSALSLSYYDLPSIIRRCFLYCAIFPKDYNINKDELIRLWMAHGYLGLEKNIEMEIIGQEYFDHLVTQSFFQDFEKDSNGNIIKCKMHDIVHDFAQFLNKDECFTMEIHSHEEPLVNSSYEKVRHLRLKLNNKALFPISIFSVKRLHSLFIDSEYAYSSHLEFLPRLFGELTCLRVLRLNAFGSSIREIPKEIEKLIHLRYLDLSNCYYLEKLPESLSELYNLQILNLFNCQRLKELPQGMGKLMNLRHLIMEWTLSLSYMPIGIQRLTCLRTLSNFIVSGNGDESKVRSLECMKNFKHLQGKLTIGGLGNLTNVSETKNLQVLTDKKNLVGLVLTFNKDGEGERINTEDEAVLEALQPPPNLENLWIYAYRGITVSPHWIISLTKLRSLSLYELQNCKHLPPLGKLPSLERYEINYMKSLKRVGNEFWGIESDATSSSVVLFPKLKALKFYNLIEWEEWDYGITVKEEEEEENIKIMPCLSSLKIFSCPKLKALPVRLLQNTTLKELVIEYCPILEERYKKGEGENWPKIAHIPNIKFNSEYVQGGPH